MRQDWAKLLFLHWEFDPQLIQSTLPDGLFVDRHDGRAYLGVVPFSMNKVRPRFSPCVPGISWFLELNLRTYVHDAQGRPGVWFYTLDCNQSLAVKLARTLFHLPYNHAKMSAETKDGEVIYQSQRRGDDTTQTFRYPSRLSHTMTAEPGSLEFFLLERYRLFSDKCGTIYSGQVHHPPYEYQELVAKQYSTRLFPLCGFDAPTVAPVSALAAQTVSVDIFLLRRND
ncbi:YqjF family protein [Rubritalea marina]|uniref:YqjF family protein n=1 Tax=Rubritalea marina TaxID=361055 RepID=UPI0005248E05|nr:DUF2071 domain-containing protein [Rubritalea marina]